jgi:NTP pyrophosphatase (non-canonical NTP hydrolase)
LTDILDRDEFAVSAFDRLAEQIHETAKEKGFWENGINDMVVGSKLALIHSEVTEVLEAIRKEQGIEATEDEFADIIIRILDLYQAMWDQGSVERSLLDVIYTKAQKNAGRPQKHGNRF